MRDAPRLPALRVPAGQVERAQHRLATFDRATLDAEARTVELAFSSELPVERWWGVEILGHGAAEVETSFIGSGTAPLLMDHNARDVVGVVQSVRLDPDRKMRAAVRFGRSARAAEVMQDVADGIRCNVSVGYELLELRLIAEEKGKPPVYRCRWKPLEVSLVSIPADPTVGVGRGSAPTLPAQPKRTLPMQQKPAPHGAPADYAQRESERREIMDMAELAGELELGRDAIARSLTLEQFRSELRASRGERRPPILASSADAPFAGSGDRRLDQAVQGFSLRLALAGSAGLAVDWGRERELSTEIARRAGRQFQGIAVPMSVFHERVLTTALPGGGPGGNLVETTLDGTQFIDLLRRALVIRNLGATVLSGLRGNLDLPRQTGAATAAWVAENAAITASDQTFGKVSLTPKHCGALTEFSRNMLLQDSPDIEMLIRQDFAALLAETMDAAAIAGTGVSNQPRGVLNTAGIGSVAMGTNGAALTFDAVADLMGTVADTNAEIGRLSYLTNTKVRRAVAKLKDSQNRPLGQASVFQDMSRTFSNVVPATLTKGTSSGICSALLYGNWQDLVVGYWSELDILTNPYESTAYAKGNIQVRGMLTADIAVRNAASFGAIQDILA
jgi:HK97 family phage major capsid protein